MYFANVEYYSGTLEQ